MTKPQALAALADLAAFIDGLPDDASTPQPHIPFIPAGDPGEAAKAHDPSRIQETDAVRRKRLLEQDAEYAAQVEGEERRLGR